MVEKHKKSRSNSPTRQRIWSRSKDFDPTIFQTCPKFCNGGRWDHVAVAEAVGHPKGRPPRRHRPLRATRHPTAPPAPWLRWPTHYRPLWQSRLQGVGGREGWHWASASMVEEAEAGSIMDERIRCEKGRNRQDWISCVLDWVGV